MTLEEIEGEFLQEGVSPSRIAELRMILSGKYAYAMNKLEEILKAKPSVWNAIREKVKSDTAAERAWQGSELGQQELHWDFQRKKIEKMMSAAKTLLEVKTAEAYNQI